MDEIARSIPSIFDLSFDYLHVTKNFNKKFRIFYTHYCSWLIILINSKAMKKLNYKDKNLNESKLDKQFYSH